MNRSIDDGITFEPPILCNAARVQARVVIRPKSITATGDEYWIIDEAKNLIVMNSDGPVSVAQAVMITSQPFLTFTAIDGRKFSQAELFRKTGTGLVLRTPTGMSMVDYEQLPSDVRKRLGFTDQFVEEARRMELAAERARIAEAKRQEIENAEKAEFDAAPTYGVEVIQVLRTEGGALAALTDRSEPGAAPGTPMRQIKRETVFLHGNLPSGLVDSSRIQVKATGDGTFEYMNAIGAIATVRRLRILGYAVD
jgi:hypothetical protein